MIATRSWMLVAAVLVAPLTLPGLAAGQARHSRNVLTVHAGAVDYTTSPVLDGAIRQALLTSPGEPIDYFTEFLEFDRFEGVETSLALRDYIARKYEGKRIDLVIAITSRSVRFVLEHRQTLFPEAAVVFAGLAGPSDAVVAAQRGVTGVRFGNAFAETMKLALRLHPTVGDVYVIADTPSPTSQEAARTALAPFARQVRLHYIEAETMAQLLADVRAVPQGSLILYAWYQRPGSDVGSRRWEPVRLVAEAAPVPVYVTVDSNIGTGAVGGMLRDTRQTGLQVGALARRVLDGTPAHTIPVDYAAVLPVFDWRQLRRWGIDAALLPPGSDIRFKSPTVWEAYRQYILGIVLVIAAQLLLIAALLVQRGRRQRAETTLVAREAALRRSFERIRRLTGRLINAQEATRAVIARDLHDDVCQDLVGVSVEISTLMRSSGRVQDEQTQRALSRLQNWALSIVDGVRRLSHELHPPTLQLLGLAAAMKAHCGEVERRYDVHVAFTSARDLGELDADVALCAFRIGQEALRNGAVHGKARRMLVSLVKTPEGIELVVRDDGRGFDLEAARRHGAGMGLVSMEERAHLVGGEVQIVTGRKQGTLVQARLPGRGPVVHRNMPAQIAVSSFSEKPQPLAHP